MGLFQNESTAQAKPGLVAIVVFNLVEQGPFAEIDFEETKPLSVLCGDHAQLTGIGHDLLKNLNFVNSPERDYYLFNVTHGSIEYTFGPGDALLVYSDGSAKGIVDQSPEDLQRIWEALTRA